jgi:hypothetical protein
VCACYETAPCSLVSTWACNFHDDDQDHLASRGIGILREAPAGSGKYYLTIPLDGAIKRIVALVREIEQVDLTATSLTATSIGATGSLKKI